MTIEHALMLALIAAVVIGGAILIADSSRSAFTELAAKRADDQPSTHSRHGDLPVTPAAESQPTKGHTDPLSPVAALLLISVMALLGLMSLKLARLRRRSIPFPDLSGPPTEIPEADLFARRQWIWKFLSEDTRNLLDSHMTVRHIMSTDLLTLPPSTPVAEATSAMTTNRCRHILICQDDRLVGMISDRDVRSRVGPRAGDIMTPDPITILPDTPVSQAITLMITKSISCLPVAREGQLIGIVTTTDFLMALQCSTRLLQQMADGQLQIAGDRRGRRISDVIAAEQQEAAKKAAAAEQPCEAGSQ